MAHSKPTEANLKRAFPKAPAATISKIAHAAALAARGTAAADEELYALTKRPFLWRMSEEAKRGVAVLEYANKLLDEHGVEAVQQGMRALLNYVNVGDPYGATLCFDFASEELFVGSWGGWLEEYELKHGAIDGLARGKRGRKQTAGLSGWRW